MTIGEHSKSLQHQLSQQLHGLSELAETITLRLLDLEERMNNIESQEKLLQAGFTSEEAEELLADSEERVRHLQSLLDSASNSEDALQSDEDSEDNDFVRLTSNESTVIMQALDEAVEEEKTFDSIGNEESSLNHHDYEDPHEIDDSEMSLLSA